MTYIPGLTAPSEEEEKKKAKKSETFEEFLKKHEKELEDIKTEVEKESKKSISKAGVEDIAHILWLIDELDSDEKVLKKLKSVLRTLLSLPKLLSIFKKD